MGISYKKKLPFNSLTIVSNDYYFFMNTHVHDFKRKLRGDGQKFGVMKKRKTNTNHRNERTNYMHADKNT